MHEPLPEDAEGIVYADLDLGMISLAKAAADPAGHYARPDVTRLLLDKTPGDRMVVRASATGELGRCAAPPDTPRRTTPWNRPFLRTCSARARATAVCPTTMRRRIRLSSRATRR